MNANVQAATGQAASGVQYEVYQAPPLIAGDAAALDRLPWKATQGDQLERVLSVVSGQGPVWAQVDGSCVRIVDGPNRATFGLQNVHRKFARSLALIALHGEILVNGVPALRLAILGPGDSICVAGLLLYVTERFCPFVGYPTKESGLFGQECPACAIEIQPDPPTCVVTCRCGAAYHHETEDTHPDLQPDERLNCLQKAKVCLRCGQALTTEERLTWDPATL